MSIPTETMPDGPEKTIILLSREINALREERDLLKEQLREAWAVARDWRDERDELLADLREIEAMSAFTLEGPKSAYMLIGQMGSVARRAIQQETKL